MATGPGGRSMRANAPIRSRLRCVYCGITRDWTDGFPSCLYAECWSCFWDHHNKKEHMKRDWIPYGDDPLTGFLLFLLIVAIVGAGIAVYRLVG